MIHARLGTGTTGAVYRATRRADGHQVALKALHEDVIGSGLQPLRERLLSVAAVDHPALPEDVDAFLWRGDPVVCRQYIRGIDLGSLVAGSAAPVQAAATVCAKAADALATVLEQTGQAHGDVKPSNLFLDLEGQVRVVDFGLSSTRPDFAEHTLTMFYGSVGFQAPEKADRNPHERSDVYSLAMVFAWLLTGDMPPRTTVNPTRHQARREDLQQALTRAEIPASLTELIVDCTTYKPEERPDMRAVHRRLQELGPTLPGAGILPWATPLIRALLAVGDEVPITDSGQPLSAGKVDHAKATPMPGTHLVPPVSVTIQRNPAPAPRRSSATGTLAAGALFLIASLAIAGGMLAIALSRAGG